MEMIWNWSREKFYKTYEPYQDECYKRLILPTKAVIPKIVIISRIILPKT